jgi:hypothetical protein
MNFDSYLRQLITLESREGACIMVSWVCGHVKTPEHLKGEQDNIKSAELL